MSGVSQTLVQRSLSCGMYFPLEDIFVQILIVPESSSQHRAVMTFIGGTLAGLANGFVMNPFARVKYQTWGRPDHMPVNFFSVAWDILKKGGLRQFFVGSSATINRDLIFGGSFAFLRHEVLPMIREWRQQGEGIDSLNWEPKRASFTTNLIAATVATILSSPVNYVRNVHYATPPDSAPQSTWRILTDLLGEAKQESTLWKRWRYIQQRLRLGWGTARVGCGMAFGAWSPNAKNEQSATYGYAGWMLGASLVLIFFV
eukprot:scaffold5626_cov258-Ochromonas_danica.AAC.1